MAVAVVKLTLEWCHAFQYGQTDAARGDGTDFHAFHVIRAFHGVGNVPATVTDDLVGRDVVSDQGQNHHANVLAHTDTVTERNFRYVDIVVDGRLQVNVPM